MQVPPHCVPIHANVTTYDWSRLAAAVQFDVIMMDPPWALATANPTRGGACAALLTGVSWSPKNYRDQRLTA